MEKTNASESVLSNRLVGSFIIISYLFSWSIWWLSGILYRGNSSIFDLRWLIAQIGVFGPSLTALLLSGITRPDLRRNALRILPLLILPLIIPGVITASNAPSGITEFTPLASIATIVVAIAIILFFSSWNHSLLNPGTGQPYEKPSLKWVFLAIIFFPALFLLAWVMVNFRREGWAIATLQNYGAGFGRVLLVSFAHNLLLGGPLGEEIGWRGFLLPQLLKKNSPFVASLILGIVWAFWHLPIDLNAGNSLEVAAAIVFRIITALSLTILFTWFYLKKGNLLVALLLHTCVNMLPDLGFSRYEVSMVLMVIFSAIAALIISASSPVFRRTSSE